VTDPDRLEYLQNEVRYWRDMALRLNQQLQATRNTPESHGGRGLQKDPTGNTAAHRVDRHRKNRN
jgi:hypothetical protein